MCPLPRPLRMTPFWFQALKYMDYIFTGVFTFEMVIKVSCVHAPPSPLLCSCVLLTQHGSAMTSYDVAVPGVHCVVGQRPCSLRTHRSITSPLGQTVSCRGVLEEEAGPRAGTRPQRAPMWLLKTGLSKGSSVWWQTNTVPQGPVCPV